jgi:hypothetical protein
MTRPQLVTLAAFVSSVAASSSFAQSSGVPLPPSAAKPKAKEQPEPKPAATKPEQTATPASSPIKGARTVTTAFEPAPFSLEESGIAFLIPKGAKADAQHGGGAAEIQIIPEDKSWIVRVYTRQFSDRGMTTGELMKNQITVVQEAVAQERVEATTLEHDKTALVAGRPAERVYLAVPGKDGTAEIVRGITAFKSQPGVFVFCDVICDRSRFEAARVVYEDLQTTLTVADPAESNEKIAALVKAGASLLSSVTEEDLREIVKANPSRWERFYTPAADGSDAGASEIGYRRVQTGVGKRSSLAEFGAGANDAEGFYVQIDSRMRVGEHYADMQGIFFLSLDRREELWTLTTALKTPAKTTVVRETGARSGENLTATITKNNAFSEGKPIQYTIPPEGYLSRVEHYLLPQIMVKKGVLSDFAFYTYQHEDSQIRLRRDGLSQADKQGKVFELSSSLRSVGGAKSFLQTTRLRSTGELIETRVADGSVWEPAGVQRLLELWKSKGLPVK